MPLVLMLAALLPQDAPPPPAEVEIVVVAKRDKCRIRLGNRVVGDKQLGDSASEWARLGTPVRVVAPRGAGYKCLARIAFRLQDRGVRVIRWLDTLDER